MGRHSHKIAPRWAYIARKRANIAPKLATSWSNLAPRCAYYRPCGWATTTTTTADPTNTPHFTVFFGFPFFSIFPQFFLIICLWSFTIKWAPGGWDSHTRPKILISSPLNDSSFSYTKRVSAWQKRRPFCPQDTTHSWYCFITRRRVLMFILSGWKPIQTYSVGYHWRHCLNIMFAT